MEGWGDGEGWLGRDGEIVMEDEEGLWREGEGGTGR